jgi:hypothetical protein
MNSKLYLPLYAIIVVFSLSLNVIIDYILDDSPSAEVKVEFKVIPEGNKTGKEKLAIWYIGTNVNVIESLADIDTGKGWRVIKAGGSFGIKDKNTEVLVPNNITSTSVLEYKSSAKRMRINGSIENFSGRVELSLNGVKQVKNIKSTDKLFSLTVNTHNLTTDILERLLLFLILLIGILFFYRKTDKKLNIDTGLNVLSFVIVVIYANIIAYVFMPGYYTGDANAFINIINSDSPNDFIPPLYLMFLEIYYYFFPNHSVGIILIQIYLLCVSLYFVIYQIIKEFLHKGVSNKLTPVISLLIFFFFSLSPIFIGVVTLHYQDHSYFGIILASIAMFLFMVRNGVNQLSLIIYLFLVLSALIYKHTSVFLLPAYLIQFVLLIKYSYMDNPDNKKLFKLYKHRYTFSFVFILISIIVVQFTLNNTYVEKKTNYYVSVPLYEMVGVYSTFKNINVSQFKWLDNYMNKEKIAIRYRNSTCLIPTLWTSRKLGELDFNKVLKDHRFITGKYLELIQSNLLELSYIKFKHFLYTLGVYPSTFSS